jgi:hypothetical protein
MLWKENENLEILTISMEIMKVMMLNDFKTEHPFFCIAFKCFKFLSITLI